MILPKALHSLALTAASAALATTTGVTASAAQTAFAGNVAAVCQSVLGTDPGTSQQGACVDALSQSARHVAEHREQADARRTCAVARARADDPVFDRCVVQQRRARGDGPPAQVQASSGRAAGPYSHASPSEIRYRERLACADLGLDPDAAGFASCVANLDSALFAADHPMN
jgi:hypothetical protein